MSMILKADEGVLVTREGGLVRKTVRGLNHSGLRTCSPEEMADREIRALRLLEKVPGVQRFVARESADTFTTHFYEGASLNDAVVPSDYFHHLSRRIRACEFHGVYRLGLNKRDYLVAPDGTPGIIDFGNVLFEDELLARIPGVTSLIRCYTAVRLFDLKRRRSLKDE